MPSCSQRGAVRPAISRCMLGTTHACPQGEWREGAELFATASQAPPLCVRCGLAVATLSTHDVSPGESAEDASL